MTRKVRAAGLLVAAMTATAAFAGCAGVEAATAQESQPAADAQARAWDPAAELVLVFGAEGTLNVPGLYAQTGGEHPWQEGAMAELARSAEWERMLDDPEPGDGHAELWAFVYRSGDGERHRAFLMDKEDRVVTSVEEAERGPGEPVGDYAVDSDRAIELALEANDGLAEARNAEQFGFVLVLLRQGAADNPVWLVAGGGGAGMAGGGGGMVLLDAATGGIVLSQGGAGMMPMNGQS